MPITKSDAKELKGVVKARFEILHDQVRQRKMEIRNRVQETIVEEHQKDINSATAEFTEIQDEIRVLNAKAKDLLDKVTKKYGDKLHLSTNRYSVTDTEHLYAVMGIEVGVPNLPYKVQERVNQIEESAGLASLNLRHQEIEFLEKLALGSVETKEAQDFFDSLPVVDEYLPLPSVKTIKQLGK